MKKTNNKFYQRVLALMLALMLCVGMMPVAVLAEGDTGDVPTHEHSFVFDKKEKSATCTESGLEQWQCHWGTDGNVFCGKTEFREITALGHDWCDWTVVKPATTAEEGLEKRVCKRDESHVETQAIPKLEQKFYTLTVIYIDIDTNGQIGVEDKQDLAFGASTESQRQKVPDGYTYDRHFGPETMPDHDAKLTVYCKKETSEEPTTYTLTVQYWDDETKKELQDKEEQQVKPGADISNQAHTGKTPAGYYWVRTDGEKVMPNGNAVLNAYYVRYRTVTIHYLETGSGKEVADKAEISVKKGESISKDSPVVAGYTPDQIKVEFDNIQKDEAATVWYSPTLVQTHYEYTVSWFDRETGKKIKDSVVRSIEAGKDIRIDSNADKTIEGYTFCPDDSDLSVPAANVAANGNTELKLVFTKNYTVTYNSNDGTNKRDATTVVTSGTDVILKTLEQLGWESREGWRFIGWGTTEGATAENVLDSTLKIVDNMGLFAVWEQIDYTVTYTWNLPAGADRALPTEQSYKAGESVTVDAEFTNTSTVTVGGRTYTFSGWDRTGDFTMPAGNVTINGTWSDTTPPPYIPTESSTPAPTPTPTPSPSDEPTDDPTDDPTDIPDPTPPLTDTPDVTPDPTATPVAPDPVPTDPPVVIPDDDPPLAEIPDEDPPLAETPDDTTEIDDEEVPLADVPKTGDDAKIWLALALLSAAGLGVLGLTQRRTRKNGEDS